MKLCPSCGMPLEVATSEGDRYTWKTERCTSANCGYLWTFADGGTIDLGLRAGIAPAEVSNFFHESPEPLPVEWKICVPVTCTVEEEIET